MLRLIAINRLTNHQEQYLCSDNEGQVHLSSPGFGFTLLCGEPAHISKTPFAVTGQTPATTWTKWYERTHPGLNLGIMDDGDLPGDVILSLPSAKTNLPAFLADGWATWLHDEEQDVAVLYRSEFALPCLCWLSRHTKDNRACSKVCTFKNLVTRVNESRQ